MNDKCSSHGLWLLDTPRIYENCPYVKSCSKYTDKKPESAWGMIQRLDKDYEYKFHELLYKELFSGRAFPKNPDQYKPYCHRDNKTARMRMRQTRRRI